MSMRPCPRHSRRKPRHRHHASTTIVQSSTSTPSSIHAPAPLLHLGLLRVVQPGFLGVGAYKETVLLDSDPVATCSWDGNDCSTIPAAPTNKCILGGPDDSITDLSIMEIDHPGVKANTRDELIPMDTHTEVAVTGTVVFSLAVDNGPPCSWDDSDCSTIPDDLSDMAIGHPGLDAATHNGVTVTPLVHPANTSDNVRIPTWMELSTMGVAIDDLCLELGLLPDIPSTHSIIVMELSQAFSTLATPALTPSLDSCHDITVPYTDIVLLPSIPTTYEDDAIHHLLTGYSLIELSCGKVSAMDAQLEYWCHLILVSQSGLVPLFWQASSVLAASRGVTVHVGLVRPPPEPPPFKSVAYFVIDHRILHATRIVEVSLSGGALSTAAFSLSLGNGLYSGGAQSAARLGLSLTVDGITSITDDDNLSLLLPFGTHTPAVEINGAIGSSLVVDTHQVLIMLVIVLILGWTLLSMCIC